ncbi:SGNH/GDSL hydrolase family protein [Chitinophaga silvisoli]|uniref:SGNH/GDSL hydrolase family protein n=1 Tax=Chitinophaga silvisoli TaxID=2291814 RepID=A0A3E1NXA7_9BACT|nr:SGNH/GDSL hydrolase family protein [Chitinophaga silvisoli]RFM32555.1 SGNH/GDSL hydrolase family protein [Chitinophaga silvisoli]
MTKRYQTLGILQFIWITLLLLYVISVSANPPVSQHQKEDNTKWVGTWGTALLEIQPKDMPPKPGIANHVLRQIVCVSIGADKLRLKFSNKFGNSPLRIRSVQIALAKDSSAIETSTIAWLTFKGKKEVILQAGTEIYSDPKSFGLKPRARIAITISFGEAPSILTGHGGSRTTSYLFAGNPVKPGETSTDIINIDHWYIIAGIEVAATNKTGSVVVFGDSIADGRGSGTNKQNRWPDILSENLLKNPATDQVGVINMGIGGNAILKGGLGPTGLLRFKHDVLDQQGVRWLILAEGINDLGGARDSLSADDIAQNLIAAYQQFIDQAHAKGIKVYGATIMPFKKSFYYGSYKNSARNKVNEWIRSPNHFDAVIDFDQLMRDPNDKDILQYEVQAGANDFLHPNELGYRLMGDGINLSLFR